jgi:hypothetical protein
MLMIKMKLTYSKPNSFKGNVSWIVSIKQNMNVNFQQPVMFVFLVFPKNGLIKSFSSFQDLSACKISWSHVEWHKFFIHLESLNVRDFGVVEATRLRIMESRSPSTPRNSTEFHENLSVCSKAVWRTDMQTHREQVDLISLLFFRKKSMLKTFVRQRGLK